jgi:3-oxoacyl-[acyl-carrier protein] reductase
MNLEGKVALVLGAIKGIGKGIALALAQEGVKVAATYFDWQEELEILQQDLAGFQPEHMIVPADLREVEKIPELVQSIIDRFGRLDIVINNIERGGWPVVHGPYVKKQWFFVHRCNCGPLRTCQPCI